MRLTKRAGTALLRKFPPVCFVVTIIIRIFATTNRNVTDEHFWRNALGTPETEQLVWPYL